METTEASQPTFFRAEAICPSEAEVHPSHRTRPEATAAPCLLPMPAVGGVGEAPASGDPAADVGASRDLDARVWAASMWRRKRPSVPAESVIRMVLPPRTVASPQGRASAKATAFISGLCWVVVYAGDFRMAARSVGTGYGVLDTGYWLLLPLRLARDGTCLPPLARETMSTMHCIVCTLLNKLIIIY